MKKENKNKKRTAMEANGLGLSVAIICLVLFWVLGIPKEQALILAVVCWNIMLSSILIVEQNRRQ